MPLWDPLTYENLMAGTVAHFERQNVMQLQDIYANEIEGPGIYALYYHGDTEFYQHIADGIQPIYVGKAAPPGMRMGGELDIEERVLQRRIREHYRTVLDVDNLGVNEFSYRVLPIVPVWIGFAEQALIRQFEPVWNSCLDGFGKHNPGINRAQGMRSWWDTLHPGRWWAVDEAERGTLEEARERVEIFFADAD